MRVIIILLMLSTYSLLFGVDAGEPPMPSQKEIEAIKAIKIRHEKQLMKLPGVVSVGISKDKDKQDALAIAVGVDKASANTLTNIPKTLEGYPVIVHDIGQPKIQ